MEQQVHLIYFWSDLAVFGEKITSLHVNDNLKHIMIYRMLDKSLMVSIKIGLGLWCLAPISAMFKLHHGISFIGRGNPENIIT
jgi:hypothetical protein